jgi:hypothetical protein
MICHFFESSLKDDSMGGIGKVEYGREREIVENDAQSQSRGGNKNKNCFSSRLRAFVVRISFTFYKHTKPAGHALSDAWLYSSIFAGFQLW